MIIVEAILNASAPLARQSRAICSPIGGANVQALLGGLHGLAQGAPGDRRAFVDE